MLTINEIYHDEAKQISMELNTLRDDFLRVSEPIQQLFNRFCTEDQLMREWKSSSRDIKNPSENYSNEKAKHLVERLRDSWQHLLRDRATRSLTYNDEQFHALEKVIIKL
jgi:TANK-binding kinase 1